MDREEILRRSREENSQMDEREKQISDKALKAGVACMSVVFIVLFFQQVFIVGGSGYDLLALYSSVLVGANYYRYVKLRERTSLFTALMWTLSCTIWLILTFWKG